MSIPRNLSKLAEGTDSSGILGIAYGGTGGSSQADAKAALGLHAVATSGSYSDLLNKPTTANIIENTNLYFTDARSRASVSASGSLSYNSATGVFSYTTPSTSGISEGTNLYYTDARARGALSASTGISYNSTTGAISTTITQYTDTLARGAVSASGDLSYNSATGVFSYTTPSTSGIVEGTNLYFTDARARASISVTGAGSYNSTTGVINIVGGVTSFNTRTGAITLSSADVTGALGFTPYNATNPSGYLTGITSSQVTTALGFTPYNSTNPNGYITGITSSNVTTALGFTPYNATNPSGYISGITSGMVTTALGYTPYNSSNPSGYITSAALSGYLTSASAASTYLPLAGGTLTGNLSFANSTSPFSNYIQFGDNTGWSLRFMTNVSGTPTERFRFTDNGAFNTLGAITQNGSQVLTAGNYNSYAPTLTGGGASGTWGISISGNSATATTASNSNNLGNKPAQDAVGANTIPTRDGNGYSYFNYINSNTGNSENAPVSQVITTQGSDGFYRKASIAHFTSAVQSNASGTWSINVTGSASSAGSAGSVPWTGVSSGVRRNYDLGIQAPSDGGYAGFFFSKSTSSSTAADAGYFLIKGPGDNFPPYTPEGITIVSDANSLNLFARGSSLVAGGNAWVRMGTGSAETFRLMSDYSLSINSSRAPIFYDSDDTSYYTSPNGNSRLYSLGLGGATPDTRLSIAGDSHFAGILHLGGTAGSVGSWGSRDYTSGGNRYFNANSYNFDNYGYGSNWTFTLSGGTGQASSSLRAPIFYDSNDTTYYVDPNSKSELKSLDLGYTSGTVYDTAGQGTLFFNSHNESDIQGYSIGTTLENYGGNYTKLTLDWHTGIKIGAAYNYGGIRFYNNSIKYYSGTEVFSIAKGDNNVRVENILYAGDVRAPIYYDNNNTAYFTDPAGRSRQSSIDFGDGGYYIHAGDWGMRNTTPYGWIQFGPANSGHAHIYTSLSNFYFNAQIQVNGGSQINTSDMRANLFYDQQDTGYFVDPNSTSNLYKLSEFTMSYNDMNAMSANSPYAARYAGSANYRNGTMGNGTIDLTTIFSNWGSGYIDSWSNPGSAPAGGLSSHYVGLQGCHYNHQNSANVYGFQMVCAGEADNRFFWRSSWATPRSWVEMLHTGNINSVPDDLRAPIFYDRNDTGYYIDPNSTSNTALRMRGGALFGPNVSWGQYLIVGGNGNWNTAYASVTTTDGNLHLDAKAGNAMYLNYYAGTAVNFGNGASGGIFSQVASDGSFRSPIFYDYADTGYYVNPNGVSYLYQLTLAGGGYFRPNNWIQMDGNYGTYWPNSSGTPHWHANDSTYGPMQLSGIKNSYSGIRLPSSNNATIGMFDSGGNGGLYNYTYWVYYWSVGNACLGVRTSSTSSAYAMYVDGGIYSTGNVVAYSDVRKKREIVTVDNALATVNKLRGVFYKRIETNDDKVDTNKRQIGVIAQEVNEVLPEAVTYAKDVDEYGVQYGNMAGLFIEAIKELTSTVEKLNSKIEELEKKVNS
jgi:hypothetical protein